MMGPRHADYALDVPITHMWIWSLPDWWLNWMRFIRTTWYIVILLWSWSANPVLGCIILSKNNDLWKGCLTNGRGNLQPRVITHHTDLQSVMSVFLIMILHGKATVVAALTLFYNLFDFDDSDDFNVRFRKQPRRIFDVVIILLVCKCRPCPKLIPTCCWSGLHHLLDIIVIVWALTTRADYNSQEMNIEPLHLGAWHTSSDCSVKQRRRRVSHESLGTPIHPYGRQFEASKLTLLNLS